MSISLVVSRYTTKCCPKISYAIARIGYVFNQFWGDDEGPGVGLGFKKEWGQRHFAPRYPVPIPYLPSAIGTTAAAAVICTSVVACLMYLSTGFIFLCFLQNIIQTYYIYHEIIQKKYLSNSIEPNDNKS
jgi:hypothetical protein